MERTTLSSDLRKPIWSRRNVLICGGVAVTGAALLVSCNSGPSDSCSERVSVNSTYTHLPLEHGSSQAMLDISPQMGNAVAVSVSGDAKGVFNIASDHDARLPFGDRNELVMRFDGHHDELVTSCSLPA